MSFTRLSLVDPVGGRQPFVSRDGLVALTANGEVSGVSQFSGSYGHEGLSGPVG
jgi:asparagine synthase (glutamine-hydrolysing)